eukprot:15602-Heterococcus_DN1.PRE.2
MDVSLVMKLIEQGYATRMITESTHGKIEEFIHPALETGNFYSAHCFYFCYTALATVTLDVHTHCLALPQCVANASTRLLYEVVKRPNIPKYGAQRSDGNAVLAYANLSSNCAMGHGSRFTVQLVRNILAEVAE